MPSTIRCLVEGEYEECTSLMVAADTPSVNLCSIKRDYGQEAVLVLVVKNINDLNEYLNLKNGLSTGQILQLSKDIVRDFPYITFADIAVIMNNARCGRYGKFYERLSPADMHTWFQEYFDERCQFFEERSISEHRDRVSGEVRQRRKESTCSIATLMDVADVVKAKSESENTSSDDTQSA